MAVKHRNGIKAWFDGVSDMIFQSSWQLEVTRNEYKVAWKSGGQADVPDLIDPLSFMVTLWPPECSAGLPVLEM